MDDADATVRMVRFVYTSKGARNSARKSWWNKSKMSELAKTDEVEETSTTTNLEGAMHQETAPLSKELLACISVHF